MEYRNIGTSGLRISVFGLGCNTFGPLMTDMSAIQPIFDRALDLGVNYVDTSEHYGQGLGEQIVGKALGARRQEVVLASKFGEPDPARMPGPEGRAPRRYLSEPGMGSRRYIMDAVDRSLRNLGTDYLDLYMVHFPDTHTPFEETARAMEDLVRAGKIRYVGLSNVTAAELTEAHFTMKLHNFGPIAGVENEWSLLERELEKEFVPVAQKYRVGVFPYFPLAGGFLTGKYRPGEPGPAGARMTEGRYSSMANWYLTERSWAMLPGIEAFAAERGRTLLDLAFGYLLSQPNVPCVMSSATRPAQIDANAAAANAWRLTTDEISEVQRLTAG